MNKFNKAFIILALGTTAICGFAFGNHKSKNNPIEVSAEQHAANFELYDYENYSGSYYSFISSGLTEGLNGSLRNTLTSNILPKEWYKYSGSGETTLSSILQEADEDPTNSNNMIYLYTRDSVKKNAASSWNREHTWPKNLSGGCWTESKAGTDILHIRPTYPTPNSTRSNNKFAEISGGTKKTYNGMDYGYISGSSFMPLDSVKGDVARICMYVWVAYKDFYGTKMPYITNVFQSYDTLLKWHTEDKPDVMEAHRNDVSETSLQKNRNPFVDHPEYAWKIFGDSASSTVKENCKKAYPDSSTPVSKTLTSISVSGIPSKTTYYVGDSFSLAGLTVTATFTTDSGTTTENVTDSVTVSPDKISADTESVTISYKYNGVTKSCSYSNFEVNQPEVKVESISASISGSKFYVGNYAQLQYEVLPSNATNKDVNFTSSNTSVATVNTSGIVDFVSAGSATLTVSSKENPTIKDTVNITVENKPIEDIPVESINAPDEIKLSLNEDKQVSFEVLPKDATDPSVTFSIANKEIAEVNNDGIIVGKKVGSTKLTITSVSNSDVTKVIDVVVQNDEPTESPVVEIEVTKKPNKVSYKINEEFDSTGLKVEAHHKDGTKEDVTNQCVISSPSTGLAGPQKVEISYDETFKTSFDIYVEASTVSSLKIAKNPAKTDYFATEEFNPVGIEVTAKINGNVTDVTDLVSYEYDFSLNNEVKVKFSGISKVFTVNVLSGEITNEHVAADYTYIFNEQVGDAQPEEVTISDWNILEYDFNQLDSACKKILKETITKYSPGEVSASDADTEKLKECATRYDEIYLKNKDNNFSDFMSRNPQPENDDPKNPAIDKKTLLVLIGIGAGVLILIVIIIIVAVSVSKKTKKKVA